MTTTLSTVLNEDGILVAAALAGYAEVMANATHREAAAGRMHPTTVEDRCQQAERLLQYAHEASRQHGAPDAGGPITDRVAKAVAKARKAKARYTPPNADPVAETVAAGGWRP